jgi:gluconate 5-dehydrogenase
VAPVTDSSKGLGWAMAEALAGAGAHVVLNSRDPKALAAREGELAAAGHTASNATFDVTDKSAVRFAVESIDRQSGRVERNAVPHDWPNSCIRSRVARLDQAVTLSPITA